MFCRTVGVTRCVSVLRRERCFAVWFVVVVVVVVVVVIAIVIVSVPTQACLHVLA